MAELFQGTELPQWLQPNNNPNGLFGPNFYAAYQKAHEDAIAQPLKDAMLNEADARTQSAQLGIVTQQMAIDTQVEQKKGEAALAGSIADISGAPTGDGKDTSEMGQMQDAGGFSRQGTPWWHKPEAEARVWEVVKAFPSLMQSPVLHQTLQNIQVSRAADAKVQEFQQTLAQRDKKEADVHDFYQQKEDLLKQANELKAQGLTNQYNAAMAKVDMLQNQIDSKERIADNRNLNQLTVQELKNKGNLEAVQERMKRLLGTTLLDKQKQTLFQGKVHSIWSDPTIPNATAKNAALDVLAKQYGLEGGNLMPGGTENDPANVFGNGGNQDTPLFKKTFGVK